MKLKEIIGKRITDIRTWSKMEVGGFDEAEVFIEIEEKFLIKIPGNFEEIETIKDLHKEITSLFLDLSDYPVYHVNPERKTIGEIIESERLKNSGFIGAIKKLLGIQKAIPREYKPWKITYEENKLKHLKGQKIVDFLSFEDSFDKGFLELENGYLISETTLAPHGTGAAGLHYYESIKNFEGRHGTDYVRLSKGCEHH